ncbi:hypothetical protein K7X08_029213 [Anisodus acutangulus]|uniref:SWIM-type domain-containing protein n=1 Tax=Anisodus acutangulus TaxID=402998 RepID=A0A9Q1L468_9SOLA|nr:hypothetical protein K7X08_029213 [Anisodus acutangulus]
MIKMSRWDQILSLPVQSPPTLEFSSAELVWSKVEGYRDNIDRVALITFARVDDFVRGESASKECPRRFHVEARRRRPAETIYKPEVDGILEYILYWCSFGPDDHRKGGIVRLSRTTYVHKKKPAGRPNTKRGCTCHFIALIIYNQDKHVDKKGLPCHGPQDKKSAGTRAMYAPYISEDLRLRVLSLLYVGVSVETIIQRHNESVERQGGPCNRDDLLTHRYVRRQERSIRRSTYELDADDAVSISMWVESRQNQVFFYENFSESDPFVLGIQTEWYLLCLLCKFIQYPIHSLVVFNSDNKAIPVAWIIAPRCASGDTLRWMRALYSRVHMKDPSWKLAGFIVDDPSADVLAIREVFRCSVLICFWRVRHACHKNLIKNCSELETCAAIAKRLGQAVHHICKGDGTADLFEEFMEDFVDAADFLDYFKATWYLRLGLWTSALRTLPLASQETCSAMEYYHNQLKLRLLNEKENSVYQRADWLVDKLGTTVHSYFWLDEFQIPDSDVLAEGEYSKVVDQEDRHQVHVVRNPASEYALCDCNWAKMGNLCEHILKSIKYLRDKGSITPSVSMFQYMQALVDMLHCPPRDSLIRDHALSLAVWVQMQLKAQLGPGSGRSKRQALQLAAATAGVVNASDKTDTLPYVVDDLTEVQHSVSATVNLSGGQTDRVATGNGTCADIGHAMENPSVEKMQTSPLSKSTCVTQFFSLDGVTSADVFAENGGVMIGEEIDTTKNLPSTDTSFANLNGFEDDFLNKADCATMVDEQPQPLCSPS